MKSDRPPFDRRPLLIGVVHLDPLPGAPRFQPGRAGRRARTSWRDRAVRSARVLAEAGFDGVLVENFGDAPFFAKRVPPETTASVAVAAQAVRDAVEPRVLVGANVLRNDGRAALAVAPAAGLDFVRVNVLTGAVVTDQGLVEGDAATLLRARAALAPTVRILADVQVKHAAPLAPRPLEEEATDLVERGGADAVILTGPRSGLPVDPGALRNLRRALPDAVILVGSGVTRATVGRTLTEADGVIVGTALERGGRTGAPLDARRANAFVEAARG
ncbi:MAG: BtpA/SgcQ family protein [Planctomycetota bacterium]